MKTNKVLFSVTSLVLLILTFGAVLYSVSIIKGLPDLFVVASSLEEKFSSDEIFEENVEVTNRELKTFYLWSGLPESYLAWVTSDQTEKVGKSVYVKSEMTLPRPTKNDCKSIYCLQKRVSFENIPGLLWRGLIGVEDYRYLDHSGVDFRALARAFWHDLRVLRLEQGGSTLTQQLVKNLYFSSERTLSRKIKEMIVSVYLESTRSKEEILAAYFNEVEWGSYQGIKVKGVFSASVTYFDKLPDYLSSYEVAILIGLLKGPYYYSPHRHSKRLRKRANIVFNKLKQLDLISRKEKAWNSERFEAWVDNLKKRSKNRDMYSMWILKSKERRSFSLYSLINKQNELVKELEEKFPGGDWASKVLVIKVDSEKESELVEKNYTKVERSLDKAFSFERHQVGSLLKPVIYTILVKMGLNLESEVTTKKISLKLKSGSWSPRESHKVNKDSIKYIDALRDSMNNPVIWAVQEYGFDRVEEKLKEYIPTLLTPLKEYPAQLLGAVELSMEELAKVYVKFFKDNCRDKDSSKVIEVLSDPLKTTVKYRVGSNLGKMKFFGKTGTTNQGLGNWFVGRTGQELFIAWVGLEKFRDAPKNMKVYGSNTSFLLFKKYFQSGGRQFSELSCGPY